MNSSEINHEFDSSPETIVVVPASELFQDRWQTAQAWPELSMADPTFLMQIDNYIDRIRPINEITNGNLPVNMSLESATKQDVLSEEQAEKLYISLSEFLADDDYARLILYLPFEFLPSSEWVTDNQDLQQAIDKFKGSYLTAWRNLLTIQDVRANFVDGDVLETQLRTSDLPRVIKAAQLIPNLVAADMIEVGDVMDLVEGADELLISELSSSLIILDEMGLIGDEINRFDDSSSEKIRETAKSIRSQRDKEKARPIEVTLATFRHNLASVRENPDVIIKKGATERRHDWLKQRVHERTIDDLANQLSELVLDETTTDDEVVDTVLSNGDILGRQVLIEGIRIAIERAAIEGVLDPGYIYEKFSVELLAFLNINDEAVRKSLVKTFRQLHDLAIVDDNQLERLGISQTNLGKAYSKNLESMADQIDQLREITTLIEINPELSQFIYPVVAIGGSRLKGYGELGSDTDIAVFIKPGTNDALEETIRDLLVSAFGNDEVIQFWLEEKNDRLNIRNSGDNNVHRADSYWTHMLFNTAWVGNENAINELRKKLLTNYFYETNEQVLGRGVRNLYLERLEQDLLQYRLMHKGYERNYPRRSRIKTGNGYLFDSNSLFWDSGYRHLATKLFINMVHLPKLASPKK